MSAVTKDTSHRSEKVALRDPYARPILKEFGPVGALTQTGTMTTAETGMPGDMMRDVMG